jgi:hypothetical protein
MDRRRFLLATTVAALAASDVAISSKAPGTVGELTLADITAAFAVGRLTSKQLT